MDDFEQRWKRIAEALQHEMSGDVRPRVSSGRTLFGIRSEVEEKMERFAREIEEEQQARLAKRREDAARDPGQDDAERGDAKRDSTKHADAERSDAERSENPCA